MELSYSHVGEYLIPNIILNEPPSELVEPLGRYGCLRRTFLREHCQFQYNILVQSEQLYPHLREVDQVASTRLDAIMSDILTFNPPPDKETDGLAWAAHMTELRRVAEKMILDEVVYD